MRCAASFRHALRVVARDLYRLCKCARWDWLVLVDRPEAEAERRHADVRVGVRILAAVERRQVRDVDHEQAIALFEPRLERRPHTGVDFDAVSILYRLGGSPFVGAEAGHDALSDERFHRFERERLLRDRTV